MMNVSVLTTGAAIAWRAIAHAQPAGPASYPSKNIRFVIGVSPGGSADVMMRQLSVKIADHWGQPIVIENRLPVVIAHSNVAKATPDIAAFARVMQQIGLMPSH